MGSPKTVDDMVPPQAPSQAPPLVVRLGVVALGTVLAMLVVQMLAPGSWFTYIYAAFGLSALGALAVAGPRAVAVPLAARLDRLAAWMARRGAFNSDAVREAPKFALIRAIFGAFLIQRVTVVMGEMPAADWGVPEIAIPLITILVLSTMVMLGLFTQLALVALIVLDWQLFERELGMSTLGNDVAAMLGILLIFSNAGAHFSLDGVLRRRRTGLLALPGRLVRATYYEDGLAPDTVIQIAKLMTLGSYWLVCVYSVMMHLSESAWMTGIAGPHLLANQFMSRFGDEFIWAFQAGGEAAVVAARVSLWAMIPWYGLVLPFVLLGGWFRLYVIYWGLAFFALCLVVLQLGWLAEFEFLFWAGLFLSPALLGRQDDMAVAYDDRCNLCDRAVNVIRRLDIFGRVDLRPVSKNADFLSRHGIATTDALTDLYGVEEGKAGGAARISHGYAFYERLTTKLVLLWPAYPFLVLGRWLRIGPAIYRFIADRRTRLFGVCTLATPKPDLRVRRTTDTAAPLAPTNPILPAFLHWAGLAVAFVLIIPAPFAGYHGVTLPGEAGSVLRMGARAAHVYGTAPIDVFNRQDLRMSENWFTLSKVVAGDGAEDEELLPLLNEKGQRLPMHRSDRVYFGHTMWFRRWAHRQEPGCHYESWTEEMAYLASHAIVPEARPADVVYRQYFQKLPSDETVLAGRYDLSPTEVICEVRFTLSD